MQPCTSKATHTITYTEAVTDSYLKHLKTNGHNQLKTAVILNVTEINDVRVNT